MTNHRFMLWLLPLFGGLLLSACGKEETQTQAQNQTQAEAPPAAAPAQITQEAGRALLPDAPAREAARELEWEDLVPKDARPDDVLEAYNADQMSDDDPRAQEMMDKLRELWKLAPVVKELDGQMIKLPGFVVPLEGDGKVVSSFLLVPYYGACIHVPPPPANQTIYVKAAAESAKVRAAFDTVWVTGRLKVENTTSELADAGYTISDARVEPYE
jgi:hypothetical protein